ncbi:MAG: hypothetical protein KAS90_00065 [Candidatus Aenigmarchaeota archaeon]|nr:hypothetical protein [Candidatus Aenigmarchaeota archaeon]
MKKTTVLVSLLAVLVLGISMTFANGPAIVKKDINCVLMDANQNPFLALASGQNVFTDSKNNNSKITCHGTLPTGVSPPTKAVVMTNKDHPNIMCWTGYGPFTSDWKAVITPSGKVMLSCHYKTP